MAEEKKDTKPKNKWPGRYFIHNPSGTIHEVSKEHAQARLKQVGYRMAKPAEIEAYLKVKNQVHNKPIGTPFTNDPDKAMAEYETE